MVHARGLRSRSPESQQSKQQCLLPESRIVPPPKEGVGAGEREEPGPLPIRIYKGRRNLRATDQQIARMLPSNAIVGLSAGAGFQSSPTSRLTAQLSMPRVRLKKGVLGSAPSRCPRPNGSI